METKTIRYHKPDLELALDQTIKPIEQHIPIVAVAYAEKRQPPLENEDITPYFAEFTVRYQAAIFMLNDSLQTNNLEANRSKDNEQTEREIADLQNQLTIAQEQELKGGNTNIVLKEPFSPIRLFLSWIIVGVLCLFEGIMNRPSFSAWGYNFIESVCMSIAFAGLLAIFAHTFERIVQKGKTIWQQRSIAISLLVFFSVLFWYLADVRAKYLSSIVAENTGTASSFSPIPFALLSLLLFIASIAICHFLLPSRKQREAMRDYRAQCDEAKSHTDKIAELKSAIKAKKLENDEMNRMHNSLQEYGAMLEQRIISQAKHGLHLWIKYNSLHRTDGRPKSFDTDNQLKFTTFFHHVNLM